MRTFFALDLTRKVISRIESTREKLGRLPGKINWVRPENLHVTMNFVGQVEDRKIPALCELGKKAASATNSTPFELSAGPAVCIPAKGYLRMIWIQVTENSGRLQSLYGDLREALWEFGVAVDDRPFRPHITLARIRTTPEPETIRQAVDDLRCVDFGTFSAGKLVLYSSEKMRTGPVYAPLATMAFGGSIS